MPMKIKVVSLVSCGILAIVLCFIAPLFQQLPMVIFTIKYNANCILDIVSVFFVCATTRRA